MAGPDTGNGEADLAAAEDFVRLFHAENPAAGPVESRLAWVRAEVLTTGTYRHTTAELTFGADTAVIRTHPPFDTESAAVGVESTTDRG